ncbi:MAG: 50S ribosomal protein L21 [Oscillospiraceae bacterium]|nr:50S ribosomal protein L21 [Oscillospiraceae bacterium]
MTAVFETGGKQYRVNEGDTVYVEKLPGQAGGALTFDTVLALVDGESIEIGSPYLSGARVEAELVKSARAKKIIVYKMRRRKNYRNKQGHRQPYTQIKITKIENAAAKKKTAKAKKEEVS